mgnify:CR=1 FL=1
MDTYDKGDIVMMKKPHPCGSTNWEVLRIGADIKIKCLGCGHVVMMSRQNFDKRMKKIVKSAKDNDAD